MTRRRPLASLFRRQSIPARWLVLMAGTLATLATLPPGRPLLASPPIAPSEPLAPAEERERFQLPAGFAIQLVASEPEIQKPMNMAFDHRGRLWVSHSVEYPFAATADVAPRDGITILEAFGPDGRATKATRFADGLNIPIGVLPLPRGPGDVGDTAIVWSIPNIWKLTDTDGDGRADRREILYGPFDCADTHGNQNAFRLGADGWVYACHGFRNASQVRLRGAGDVVVEMQSGHTYRFRPDGSAIELVTRGQVNPFGMCVDRLGNRFTVDCHSKPITMLLRGGCYESFGKPHDGLGFAPATTADDHGSTGLSGAVVYDAAAFPADYHGSAFVGNVITNAVHRDRIAWRGSSPWVDRAETFLSCDDWWFRPVDLQLGPDGCLYVADFYNCIIGHYEVDLHHPRRDRTRGRIWRVVWQGEPAADGPPAAPALDDDTTPSLLRRLADPTITVRRLAWEQLAARCQFDPAALAAVLELATAPAASADDNTAVPRSLAVRALAVCDRLDATAARRIAADAAPIVRVHLAMALAGAAGWNAERADLVRTLLADTDPFVRRAAAETLAAHPEPGSLPPLLRAWTAVPPDDHQLIHAVKIAIRDHVRDLDATSVATLPLAPDAWLRLAEIAATIPRESAAWLAFNAVRDHESPAALISSCVASVAEHCGVDQLDEAVRFARKSVAAEDLATEASAYRPLLDGWVRRGSPPADAGEFGHWGDDLASRILGAATAVGAALPPQAVSLALDLATRRRLLPLAATTVAIIGDERSPADVRAAAVTAALALDRPAALAAASPLLLDGRQPSAVREAIARRLGADGSADARDALAAALPTAPAAVQQPIALALAGGADGGEKLLALVAAGKASARLLQDKPVRAALAAAKLPDLDSRIADLTKDLPPPDQAVDRQIATLAAAHAGGTPSRENGAAVFRRSCAACHRLAGEGAALGPALDGVGQRGPQRLLEDILDPSRNVDEAFRTTTITTADGRSVSGLRLRDEGADVVLADATGREIRVARADIEESAVTRLSPMPSNMAAQLGEQNLVDLLHYLLQPRP
jgi:putative membrane-bound dehydrogenase-like protein